MTALLDLDAAPVSAPAPAPARRLPDVVKFSIAALVGGVLATVAAVAAFTTLAQLADPAPAGVTPLLMFSAAGDRPTATVWYADGTHGEASQALTGPWRPDRPIRMVTVAASEGCSIAVDERLVVAEQAPPNRVAVCVWTAPR